MVFYFWCLVINSAIYNILFKHSFHHIQQWFITFLQFLRGISSQYSGKQAWTVQGYPQQTFRQILRANSE